MQYQLAKVVQIVTLVYRSYSLLLKPIEEKREIK